MTELDYHRRRVLAAEIRRLTWETWRIRAQAAFWVVAAVGLAWVLVCAARDAR